MDAIVKTYDSLLTLVDLDKKDHCHNVKASLLLKAMTDWPTENLISISGFIKEVKSYFGTPLTKERINELGFDGNNAWQIETGLSILALITYSMESGDEENFDEIVQGIMDYYFG